MDEETVKRKPAFDGRSAYYNLLEKNMVAIISLLAHGNYDRCVILLWALFNHTKNYSAYPNLEKKINDGLHQARSLQQTLSMTNLKDPAYQKVHYKTQMELENTLLEVHGLIFESAKDLLLTTSQEETIGTASNEDLEKEFGL